MSNGCPQVSALPQLPLLPGPFLPFLAELLHDVHGCGDGSSRDLLVGCGWLPSRGLSRICKHMASRCFTGINCFEQFVCPGNLHPISCGLVHAVHSDDAALARNVPLDCGQLPAGRFPRVSWHMVSNSDLCCVSPDVLHVHLIYCQLLHGRRGCIDALARYLPLDSGRLPPRILQRSPKLPVHKCPWAPAFPCNSVFLWHICIVCSLVLHGRRFCIDSRARDVPLDC